MHLNMCYKTTLSLIAGFALHFLHAQQPELNDGPYVFYNQRTIEVATVKNGEVKHATYEGRAESLQVATDRPDVYFSVTLKELPIEEPVSYPEPSKLMAFADIEGNFTPFRELLQNNGVMDDKFNWTFGKGHLVLVGDFFDRGQMVTEVLWLIYKLEQEAQQAGGYVHFILGNHEIMNLQGDFGYVNPKYKTTAKQIGKTLYELYHTQSELGLWLRTKNITEKIGDLLFTHAGISKETNALDLSLEQINTKVRPYYDYTEEYYPDEDLKILMSEVYSPFWYRGYYLNSNKKEVETTIDATLKKFGVKHIVTGHTVVAETITAWYDQKVINLDTRHASGYSEALWFENGQYYRVTKKGEKYPLFK